MRRKCLLDFSANCPKWSDDVHKVGLLELIEEYDIEDSGYESGSVSKSMDAKLVKETNTINYQTGNAFGVIIENLEPNTKINATWTYPKKDTRGKYTYPERHESGRYFIYWVLDKGELTGNYSLIITINNNKPKNILFNVE